MAALNKNNSAIKRIMQEARELANDPSTEYTAAPLEDDVFEWHCTIKGPAGTEFEGGIYHLRILLPAEYPFRPPSLMLLTPNGRFELNTKICISFTNYHEEMWQPAWGIRTAILGLQGFFPLKGQAAAGVGSIECPATERKRLASLSRSWICPHCQQPNSEILPDALTEGSLASTSTETSSENNVVIKEVDSQSMETDEVSTVPSEQKTTSAQIDGPVSDKKLHTGNANPCQPVIIQSKTSREGPPIILDAAICCLLVLVFALICRRMF